MLELSSQEVRNRWGEVLDRVEQGEEARQVRGEPLIQIALRHLVFDPRQVDVNGAVQQVGPSHQDRDAVEQDGLLEVQCGFVRVRVKPAGRRRGTEFPSALLRLSFGSAQEPRSGNGCAGWGNGVGGW